MKRMKRRWRLLLGLALLLLVGGSFLHPAVRWRVIGWVKGEAFCQGRPTTYWSRETDNLSLRGITAHGPFLCPHVSYMWERSPSRMEQYLAVLTGNSCWEFELLKPERAALPVLIELLHDPTPKVRQIAAQGLQDLGSEAKPAFGDLLLLCNDRHHPSVRQMARQALRPIDPDAAAKAGIKWDSP
jgi:hypothetical protein